MKKCFLNAEFELFIIQLDRCFTGLVEQLLRNLTIPYLQ